MNRKPRFTVLDMGEYMAADDGPRETLLRNMKFERMAPTLMYRSLYQAVASYLASPTKDLKILARCREDIKTQLTMTTNVKARENLTYELRALDAFEAARNAMPVGGVILERSTKAGSLTVEGVKISVRPSALVRASRPRSIDLLGALVVDVAKGVLPKTDEAQARLTNGMVHGAVLIHQFVEATAGDRDGKPHPEHCAVFHAVRSEWVCAPVSHRKMLRNVEAVCRNIARSWAGIIAPANFDPKLAVFRD